MSEQDFNWDAFEDEFDLPPELEGEFPPAVSRETAPTKAELIEALLELHNEQCANEDPEHIEKIRNEVLPVEADGYLDTIEKMQVRVSVQGEKLSHEETPEEALEDGRELPLYTVEVNEYGARGMANALAMATDALEMQMALADALELKMGGDPETNPEAIQAREALQQMKALGKLIMLVGTGMLHEVGSK